MAIKIHNPDRYNFISHEDWNRVCALLIQDAINHNLGIVASAPSHPEYGEEPKIEIYLETEGMNWFGEGIDRPLSEILLHGNEGYGDEVPRMIQALENTIAKLEKAVG